MSKVTMQLEGMEALQAAITRAPDRVRALAGDAVASTSFAIAQRMRSSVPVATGTLKRAIFSRARGLSGGAGILPEAYYWRFIEYGTVKLAARPFLRPAVEAESETYIQKFQTMGRALERDFAAGRFL